MKPTSLLRMDVYEQRNLVSTPKSLEACRLEGVEPHELLYRQRDSFLEEAEDEEHAQLLYEYHEKQRQDILRLVTQRRQLLDGGLDRSSRQSRSSGNLFHSELFDKEVERAREKHVKMITQIMGYEMSASSKLNELQKTQSERETLEQHRQRAIQVRMKRVAEEKRQHEQELREQELQEQKLAKRQAIREMEQELMDSLRKADLEAKQQREREKKSQEKEMQRKEKRERVEEFLDMQTRQLEERLRTKFQDEERRQRDIQRRQNELKKKLAQQGAQNELKRKTVLDNLQNQIEQKRRELQDKEARMQQQTLRFRTNMQGRIKSLQTQSREKDVKIQRTREVAEEQLEKFRRKVNGKMTQSQMSVEQQRRKELQKIQRKKWKEALKQQQRDWNVNRQRKKEEYERLQLVDELEDKQRRTELYLSARDRMIKQRSDLNFENDMQKSEIKQAMLRMALSKKWDPKAIEDIVKQPQSRPRSHGSPLV